LLSYTRYNHNLVYSGGDVTALYKGTSTELDSLFEYAARVCYLSTAAMGTAPNFIAKRLEEGHEDVVEHGTFTYRMPAEIAVTLPFLNQHIVVSPLWDGDRLDLDADWPVSGNARVWLSLFRRGKCLDLLPELAALAPLTFAEFNVIPPAKPRTAYNYQVNVEEAGEAPQRVVLLAANLPTELRPEYLKKHGTATFLIEHVSRTLTHQLVRHRLGSFCLDGDAVVYSFARSRKGSSSRKRTMRQLWEMSNDPKQKGRLKLIRLRGMNERNELIPVPIKRVIHSGIQPVFQVETESGRTIRATAAHRFFTPEGWRRLGELKVSDRVWANGVPAYQNSDYLRQRYLEENMERSVLAQELGVADSTLGKWLRKFGLQKPKPQYPNRKAGHGNPGMHTAEERSRISERMTGKRNHRWLGDQIRPESGRTRANRLYSADRCALCQSDYRVQRHHKDGDPTNNQPDNIVILCDPCHKANHFGQVVMTVFPDRITAIEYAGEVDTYDLEIDHPCHNFIANGFVVHNSQESQRYVDLAKGGWQPIIPPAIASKSVARNKMANFYQIAEDTYDELRAEGIRKEDARFLLPGATESRIVVTMNFAGWDNFLWQRLPKAAQWEIRSLARPIHSMLSQIAPSVFSPIEVYTG
jgi:thymidylate synthase ThyX